MLYPFFFEMKPERTQFDPNELFIVTLFLSFFDTLKLLAFVEWVSAETGWQLHSFEYQGGRLTVRLKPPGLEDPDDGSDQPKD